MTAADADARYSIRIVSRMSGVSAHTLRMWERRYGFPQPERTPGGARRYTEEDVEQLKLVNRALDLGYRPNEVVGKDLDSLRKIVAEQEALPAAAGGDLPDVDRALEHVTADDYEQLGLEIRRAVAVLGPRQFVTDFAAPLVTGVGALWNEGKLTVGQEHLTTELLTTELRVLLRAYASLKGRPRVVLATLPSEDHVLGLSMVALYLAVNGAEPRIAGARTPASELADLAERTDADVVGLSVSGARPAEDLREAIASLASDLPSGCEIWLGGSGAKDLEDDTPAGVSIVIDWDEIDGALSRWRAGS